MEMARGRAVPVEDVAGKPRIRRPRYNRRSRRSNGETATDSNTSDDVKRDEEPCEGDLKRDEEPCEGDLKRDEEPCEDDVKREEERCEEEPCDINDIKIEVEEA